MDAMPERSARFICRGHNRFPPGPKLLCLDHEERIVLYRANRGWTVEAALTIALFLVVQAFFSGLSLGARADTLDPSGGVICFGSGSAASDPLPSSQDRSHLVDCCTLGCPMIGGLAAPHTAGAAAPHVFADAAPAFFAAHLPGRFELSPLRSRAPPRA